MARYSSDSDDDRRRKEKRSKSSRKRSKRSRSRSRDRGRKPSSYSKSSRSHRRRSRSLERRSRESSYDSYRSSSTRRSRGSRVSRSRSQSRSSEDRCTEKRTQDVTVTKEQTKERIKEALNAIENKDDDLLKSKEKNKLGKEVIPSISVIAQIESNEFVQQSFTSSSTTKHETSQTDQGVDDAIFSGTRVPSLDMSKILTTNLADNEGLFAPALLEDEDTKMKRWIIKLTSKRSQLLAASID